MKQFILDFIIRLVAAAIFAIGFVIGVPVCGVLGFIWFMINVIIWVLSGKTIAGASTNMGFTEPLDKWFGVMEILFNKLEHRFSK